MISNERPSPFHRQPNWQTHHQPYGQPQPPRPFVQEDTLKSSELQIERKTFILTLKENLRGRFLRITEERGENWASIIIPSVGLREFKKMLDIMVEAEVNTPAPLKTEPPQTLLAKPASSPAAPVAPTSTPAAPTSTPAAPTSTPAAPTPTPTAALAEVSAKSPVKAKPAKKTPRASAKAKLPAAAKARRAKTKASGKKAD